MNHWIYIEDHKVLLKFPNLRENLPYHYVIYSKKIIRLAHRKSIATGVDLQILAVFQIVKNNNLN